LTRGGRKGGGGRELFCAATEPASGEPKKKRKQHTPFPPQLVKGDRFPVNQGMVELMACLEERRGESLNLV